MPIYTHQMAMVICWQQFFFNFLFGSKEKAGRMQMGLVSFVRAQREQRSIREWIPDTCQGPINPISSTPRRRGLPIPGVLRVGGVACPLRLRLRSPVQRSELRHGSAAVRPFPSPPDPPRRIRWARFPGTHGRHLRLSLSSPHRMLLNDFHHPV